MDAPPVLANNLGFLLKHAHLRLRAISETLLEPLGVGGREVAILSLLDAEGPRSQQRLAARLEVDRTTMVAIVDGLEQKGLVARRRDPADRRAYALELTAEGKRKLKLGQRAVAAAEHELLEGVPESDRDVLVRSLQRMIH